MNAGETLTMLVDRDGYLLRLPAPYSEATARNHLDALDPVVASRLSVVTLAVVDVRPAETREERGERDTEPCRPLSEPEFHAVVLGVD